MIDIHSHILPRIDDGPKNIGETAEMLSLAAADGITDIVATPHANLRYSFDRGAVESMINSVREKLSPGLTIHCGCHFRADLYNVRDAIKNPTRYVIDRTPYLLVGLPQFFNVKALDKILNELKAAGLIPIISNPERHAILQGRPELLNTWIEHRYLVQITAQSILGRFGRSAKRTSTLILESGLAHFVASDAHDPESRPPLLSEAFQAVREKYGIELADAIFTGNARKLLEGRPIGVSYSRTPNGSLHVVDRSL